MWLSMRLELLISVMEFSNKNGRSHRGHESFVKIWVQIINFLNLSCCFDPLNFFVVNVLLHTGPEDAVHSSRVDPTLPLLL